MLLFFASTALAQTPTPEPIFDVWFVEHADPKVEFQRNLARGDLRFLCLRLIGTTCPTQAGEWRIAKHGTRLIADSSDYPRSEAHQRAIEKAKEYAGIYNELLFEYLKTHE